MIEGAVLRVLKVHWVLRVLVLTVLNMPVTTGAALLAPLALAPLAPGAPLAPLAPFALAPLAPDAPLAPLALRVLA